MATEEKKKDPRTVQLLGVRGSFTDALVDKKKTANTDDAKEKYGCNLILETTGPMAQYFEANKAKIRAALEAAGFVRVAHVVHGFEGELNDAFKRSSLNGWRFEGLPWEQM